MRSRHYVTWLPLHLDTNWQTQAGLRVRHYLIHTWGAGDHARTSSEMPFQSLKLAGNFVHLNWRKVCQFRCWIFIYTAWLAGTGGLLGCIRGETVVKFLGKVESCNFLDTTLREEGRKYNEEREYIFNSINI